MKGSCLCKQVTFEAKQLCTPISHCSCTTCRKSHSAAFNTAAGVKPEDFQWLTGEDLLTGYESSKGKVRYFCKVCGSQLIAKREGALHWVLRVATLDESPNQTPAAHIFTAEEVDWLCYNSDIPRYPGWGNK